VTMTSNTQMSAKFYEQLAHLEQYEKWPQDVLYGEQDMPQSRSKAGKRKRSSSSKKVPTATATKRGRYYSSHVSMHTMQVVGYAHCQLQCHDLSTFTLYAIMQYHRKVAELWIMCAHANTALNCICAHHIEMRDGKFH
jgi:hypothetical protein